MSGRLAKGVTVDDMERYWKVRIAPSKIEPPPEWCNLTASWILAVGINYEAHIWTPDALFALPVVCDLQTSFSQVLYRSVCNTATRRSAREILSPLVLYG